MKKFSIEDRGGKIFKRIKIVEKSLIQPKYAFQNR